MMESDTPHVYIAPLNHRCAHAVYAHYITANESEQLHCEICDLSKKYEYEYIHIYNRRDVIKRYRVFDKFRCREFILGPPSIYIVAQIASDVYLITTILVLPNYRKHTSTLSVNRKCCLHDCLPN